MRKVNYFRIAYHSLLILVWMGLPFLIFYGKTKEGVKVYGNPLLSPFYWFLTLSFLALFYGYTYYIIPRFYLKKKYLTFLAITFLLLIVFTFLKPFEFLLFDILLRLKGMPKPRYDPTTIDLFTIFLFLMVVAFGLSRQIFRQWRVTEIRAMQAETDKANAELSFLKAQINPHFLFNTLNNIYSLAITQNVNTAPSIMKLSNIMRYVTDDAARDLVTLDRELDCIRDYINLQSLRLGKNMQVTFEVTGRTANKKIAPLILMTFIENIFKYGITTQEQAAITIKLNSELQKISFFCQNRIFEHQSRMENTGIGLTNTKQRLELVYPDRHTLEISEEKGLFTVHLTLLA